MGDHDGLHQSAVRDRPLSLVIDLMASWQYGAVGCCWGGLPVRFGSSQRLFFCFSVVDRLQTVRGYPVMPHPAGNPSPFAWATFQLVLPTGPFTIEVVDLLRLIALAEHWRLRRASYLNALLLGILEVLLADGFILVTQRILVSAILASPPGTS